MTLLLFVLGCVMFFGGLISLFLVNLNFSKGSISSLLNMDVIFALPDISLKMVISLAVLAAGAYLMLHTGQQLI